MLKKLFINWEDVFYKCVNSTFDYLKEFPKDWTGKNAELNKENISMKIEKFLFTDKLYIKPPGTKPEIKYFFINSKKLLLTILEKLNFFNK